MAEVSYAAYVQLLDDNHKLRAQRDALKGEVKALKEMTLEALAHVPDAETDLIRRMKYVIAGEVV